jgi:hypothetical protein
MVLGGTRTPLAGVAAVDDAGPRRKIRLLSEPHFDSNTCSEVPELPDGTTGTDSFRYFSSPFRLFLGGCQYLTVRPGITLIELPKRTLWGH